MKSIVRLFAVVATACVLLAFMLPGGPKYFGKKIDAKGAVAVTELPKMMEGKQSIEAKITGKVTSVCQKKGCWMTMELGNGQTMRVTFKDYAFFMPKDCAGGTVVLAGKAMKSVETAEEQRHYMQDAGKSAEEIAKVQGDKTTITFEAEGVILTAAK
jgi:hypothetical protein